MKLLLLSLAIIIAVSGCTAGPGPTGQFELLISDQPTDIAAFDQLLVSISSVTLFPRGGSPFTLDAVTDVDLTQITGDNALSILTSDIPRGTYDRISLDIAKTDGVIAGDSVVVEIPSNMLMVIKPFTIGEDSVSFVFDISVVSAGESDKYNLLPVIGDSGLIGSDIPSDRVKRGEIGPDQKMDHARDIIERARNNMQKGDGLLDEEKYDEAKDAYSAAMKGFDIAEDRYRSARDSLPDAARADAETGLKIAMDSRQAVDNLVRAVDAYQRGDDAVAMTLGQDAVGIFDSLPSLPGVEQ